MWFRCKCEISTLLNLICNDDDNDDDGLVVVVMGNRGRTTNWCISGELMCNVWKKRYRVKKLINASCTVCLVMPLNHFNPNRDIIKIELC